MTSQKFHITRPISAIISRLPTRPPSFVFARLLNMALQKALNHQDLLPLHGKRVVIQVRDIGLQLHFTLGNNGFRPIAKTEQPDLTITASMHDFYLLATRQEDPDALFFNRRLLVEGDTELGLVAKNTLDGIELTRPTLAMLSPKNILAWAKAS